MKFNYYMRLAEMELTEKELCKLARISMRTLKRFKNGNQKIPIPVLIMLKRHLQCSFTNLLVAFY